MRQIGMALLMYRQDYDEQNVISNDCDFSPPWMQAQLILAQYMRQLRRLALSVRSGRSRTVNMRNPCRTRFFSYSYNRWTDGRVNAVVDKPAGLVVFLDGVRRRRAVEGNCDSPYPGAEQDQPCRQDRSGF